MGRRRIAQGLCHALTQGTGDRAALHRALFGSVGAGFEQWGQHVFAAIRGEPIEVLFDAPRTPPWRGTPDEGAEAEPVADEDG